MRRVKSNTRNLSMKKLGVVKGFDEQQRDNNSLLLWTFFVT
jgi:hypothetical protein